MPQHLPALAARAAVATSTTALALAAALPGPATTPAAPAAATSAYAPATHVAASTFAPGRTASLVAAVAAVPAAAPAPSVPTARSTTALSKAMGKIGSPYRWGASGPNAFDCSGLVSWAYKQVGVSLPRSSNAMSKVGQPVSRAQLRPGDLVFFYKPVSHVAMYIGGGKVVHASTSSQPVKISNLADMPFSGARRV